MKNVARNIASKVKPSTLSKMKISYLLFLCCFVYISVYDVRGVVQNIMDEFKDHFKDYLTQKSSRLICFNVLKKKSVVCPCAFEQLQRIQEDFQDQNSTEVVMMKNNLQVLIDQLMKSGKSKGQTMARAKQGCKFECRDPNTSQKDLSDIILTLEKRNCFKGSRK